MKTKLLFFAAIIAASMISCGKSNAEDPIVPEESDFTGTVTVIYEGTAFDNENILVSFVPAEDGKSASITLHQIRFVPDMPLAIDTTIPGITLHSTSEKISLSCERVVPLAMGGEFPRYTVTNLRGEQVGTELSFSLNFGEYPTSFKGQRANTQ